MMVVNPLVKDAMQRAGEEMPADGVLVMSSGNAIACAIDNAARQAAEVAGRKMLKGVAAAIRKIRKEASDLSFKLESDNPVLRGSSFSSNLLHITNALADADSALVRMDM